VTVDLSLWRLILDASLIVQLVMVILVVASVLSWLVILVKSRTLKVANRASDEFEERFWSGIDLAHLYDGVRRKPDMSGIEHVFSSGFKEFLRTRQQPAHVVDSTHRSMRVAISREGQDLERYLQFLATVGSTSPYIGLFGTVWGIMHAFLGLSGAQQATLQNGGPGDRGGADRDRAGSVRGDPGGDRLQPVRDRRGPADRASREFQRRVRCPAGAPGGRAWCCRGAGVG
jgi:biopolymer transport protein TolQ